MGIRGTSSQAILIAKQAELAADDAHEQANARVRRRSVTLA
jgi:hypothetical protein